MTAVIALVYLIHLRVCHDRRRVWHPARFRIGINKPLRPSARYSAHGRKSTRKSPDASPNRLACVRVVRVITPKSVRRRLRRWRAASARQCVKTLTATSRMIFPPPAEGIVSANHHGIGAQDSADTMTLGTFLPFNIFLGLLVAPVFQIVASARKLPRPSQVLAHAANSEREAGNDEPVGPLSSIA